MPRIGLGVRVNRQASGVTLPRPTDLVIVTGGTLDDRTITASWTSPVDPVPTGYTVQLSTNGVTWGDTQSIAAPTTTAEYTGLADGAYYLRVRAVYSKGVSGWLTSGVILVAGAALLPVINWGWF